MHGINVSQLTGTTKKHNLESIEEMKQKKENECESPASPRTRQRCMTPPCKNDRQNNNTQSSHGANENSSILVTGESPTFKFNKEAAKLTEIIQS